MTSLSHKLIIYPRLFKGVGIIVIWFAITCLVALSLTTRDEENKEAKQTIGDTTAINTIDIEKALRDLKLSVTEFKENQTSSEEQNNQRFLNYEQKVNEFLAEQNTAINKQGKEQLEAISKAASDTFSAATQSLSEELSKTLHQTESSVSGSLYIDKQSAEYFSLYNNVQKGLSAWLQLALDSGNDGLAYRITRTKYFLSTGSLYLSDLLVGSTNKTINNVMMNYQATIDYIGRMESAGYKNQDKLIDDIDALMDIGDQRYEAYQAYLTHKPNNSGTSPIQELSIPKLENLPNWQEISLGQAPNAAPYSSTAASQMSDLETRINNMDLTIKSLNKQVISQSEKTSLSPNESPSNSIWITAVLFGVGVFISGGIVARLTRRIQQDADTLLTIAKEDQFNELVSSNLDSIHERLNASNEDIGQLITNTQLKREQQQSETEHTEAALLNISNNMSEISNKVSEALSTSAEADEQISAGKLVVQQAIQSIEELASDVNSASDVILNLEEQSQKVGAFLEVIVSIAEQTNLLALNAAIEAARAGDQGRGFAVVADEVRTLAKRTQDSTQQIRDIIEVLQAGTQTAVKVMQDGKDKANQSVEQTSSAGEAFERVLEIIGNVTNINQEVEKISSQLKQDAHKADDSLQRMKQISQSDNQTIENLQGIKNGLVSVTVI